jgi:hypothetical protein
MDTIDFSKGMEFIQNIEKAEKDIYITAAQSLAFTIDFFETNPPTKNNERLALYLGIETDTDLTEFWKEVKIQKILKHG